jgi:hypothetical protein
MKNEIADILAQLVETVEQAIRSGDWDVDGRNDPDMILYRSESILKEYGYRRDSLSGEEFLCDYV